MDGERRWVTYETLDDDDSDFEQLGDAFDMTGLERRGPAGHGTARLVSQRALVDFAVAWMERHRR